jgi:hypothetical protein
MSPAKRSAELTVSQSALSVALGRRSANLFFPAACKRSFTGLFNWLRISTNTRVTAWGRNLPGDSPLPQLRFSIGEAARIWRISRVTLYQRIGSGLIQIQKDGRRSFVTATELQRYANSNHWKFRRWQALRLGRLLFLMENVVNDPALSWPKEMIHYGAQVLSRDNLEHVLSDIPAVTLRFDGDLA